MRTRRANENDFLSFDPFDSISFVLCLPLTQSVVSFRVILSGEALSRRLAFSRLLGPGARSRSFRRFAVFSPLNAYIDGVSSGDHGKSETITQRRVGKMSSVKRTKKPLTEERQKTYKITYIRWKKKR